MNNGVRFLAGALAAVLMSSEAAAGDLALYGTRFLLKTRYPMAAQPEAVLMMGRDPSYGIFETCRYAYDTYGYLFLDEAAGTAGAVSGEHPGGAKSQEDPANQPSASPAASPGALEYSIQQLMDYDFLMKHFYSVHSSTTAGRETMNAEKFLSADMKLQKDPSVPQILIYHTHSQETFADYGPDSPDANIVTVGNYLTELLREKGWNVIHDTSSYDMQSGKLDRNNAYTYALDGISGILQEHPTIQVILDIHRDGVGENTRLAADVGGKPTAQIMFFHGMSRTPEGPIEYLPNPNLDGNLAFAFQMQLAAARLYPGFTRKIYLKGLRYNLHLRPRSSLIEVGAQTNTLEEAKNAMEPLAELFDMVLQGK